VVADVPREAGRDPVQVLPVRSDIIRMERSTSGYEEPVRTHDDDGLRSEVGQTLALFGMSLAVVLVGLLVGLGL
jgi:hypothetical protein